jgi:transcriptional regulator with XRE-family HTH domain
MTYATQDIFDALKSAREAKGLSQRAVSARTGVPQSHISKIESGGADIRLSSLIELARALDLELKLVPRKAVPAVNNVVRSVGPSSVSVPALKELNRTLNTLKGLRTVYPDLSALTKLQDSFQTFKHLNIGTELEALREITKPIREIQKLTKSYRDIAKAVSLPAEQIKALQQAASSAQALRNQLVHNIPQTSALPRPAYRLDEEEEDGHG